jgi:uncharacterized protein
MAKFRILSLDGGGSWALIQVMALQKLYSEQARGHEVLKDFNLLAANSGGSIVLGGLIADFSLDRLLNHFCNEHERRRLFCSLPFRRRWGLVHAVCRRLGIAPKYLTASKLTELEKVLGEYGSLPLVNIPSTIEGSVGHQTHFLICAFDYDRKRAVFFRSYAAIPRGSTSLDRAMLANAINASSTAPVQFFDEPAMFEHYRLWDGAVAGYNNPTLRAVAEALTRHDPADIQVLSIGTGSVRLPIVRDPEMANRNPCVRLADLPTLGGDLAKFAESIVDDPPDAASFIAHVALRQPVPNNDHPGPTSGSIIRMSPMVQPRRTQGEWHWPKTSELTEKDLTKLTTMNMDAVKKRDVERIIRLARSWLIDQVTNQPISSQPDTGEDPFGCLIGHSKFSEAKAAWERLKGQDRLWTPKPSQPIGFSDDVSPKISVET